MTTSIIIVLLSLSFLIIVFSVKQVMDTWGKYVGLKLLVAQHLLNEQLARAQVGLGMLNPPDTLNT